MHLLYKKFLTLVFIVQILVSGMYFEYINVETSFAKIILEQCSAETGNKNDAITHSTIGTNDICNVRNEHELQQFAKESNSQGNSIKLSFGFLLLLAYSFILKKLVSISKSIWLLRYHQKNFLLNYIHDLDGKKRNLRIYFTRFA